MANNITLTKQQQQMLVLSVLMIGGGAFAYFKYFWMPVSKSISEVSEQLTAVKKEIEEAKQARAQLKKIEAALVDLEKELSALSQRLPKDRDIPGIIDKVSELTRRFGVQLTNLSIGGTAQKQGYIENYYTLTIRATYHELGRLLAALVLEERVLNTRDINFAAPDPEGELNLQLPLVAYQYSEKEK